MMKRAGGCSPGRRSGGWTRREALGAGGALLATTAWGGSGTASDPADLTLAAASDALRRGALSPVDLTRACLARIDALDPALGTFITVTAEQALADAREREAELARGRSRGPLHGIPLALKDNIDTAGLRTTAAAAAFADRVPMEDAEVTRRLRDAGAVLLGKLNMDECALGVSSTMGAFGPVHNPWARDHIAGGSSGGPAAAVAARLCFGALGTDTGGSIRQPAAYCGLTGLKPSYGLVSTRGVVPLAWSLDHVGPLARTAADAALLLQAIAGYDRADPASMVIPAVDYPRAAVTPVRRLRLGRPCGFWWDDLDSEVAAATTEALRLLGTLTAGVRDVELPPVPALPLMPVEANAGLGAALKASPAGFSPAFRAFVEGGARVTAAAYAEARRQLELIRREAQRVFAEVDLVVTPTTPDLPATLEAARVPAPRRGPPASARNTTPFNVFGLPAVSVCCGFSRTGLPLGLQIAGPALADGTVLALAHAWQQVTDWQLRAPALPAVGGGSIVPGQGANTTALSAAGAIP